MFKELEILDKNNYEKGKSFENLIEIILDKLGYKDIKTRVRKTGMEIDLMATANQKVSNKKILCECKAHKKPIQSKDLLYFIGKFSI